ncbi:Small-conductance mechanosensitive channel [Aliiroseovarius sediminilitoris]|uniref:Small-conductance mechanosensitive channel n=1 Tax=Aliiroseovarius sediminilitoris TaxID=1173584 RepID=A0A1I0Q9R0_9RHOB|nr:mechanosensitive ion channel family protein [Aliiroseovarius sediminilitoris]SEW23609.1 Small-conductance mechanosensitive channel [Aliiroseovarius sediminilitoris]
MGKNIFRVMAFALLLATSLPVGTALAQSSNDGIDVGVETEIVDTDQTISVTESVRDDQIATRIQAILKATGWYEGVQVDVQDGIVFLDGTAASSKRQDWARDLAAKTDGVVAVVNRLTVAQDADFSIDPAISELRSLWDKTVAAAPLILLALLILPLALFLSAGVARLARWALKERLGSPFLRDVTARFIALPVFLVGLYIVLQIAGLTQLAISVLGGAGVIGIVIGFAFRDIAENFLASLLLSLRQPFRRGDFVDVAGHQGVVHSMNTRSTVLVSPEGNHIQIPNAAVFKATIENFSASPSRRGSFEVGIGYDASISDVQKIILRVLSEHDAISTDPEPMVLADTLGASTVIIKIYYWFDGEAISPLKLKSVLIRRVMKALIDAGISMPDEAREIIFPEGIPLASASTPDTDKPNIASKPEPKREPERTVMDEDLSNEVDNLEPQMQVQVEGDKDSNLLDS